MLKRYTQPACMAAANLVAPLIPPKPQLTAQKLKRAARLRRKIDALRRQLAEVLGVPAK
jgi:hypothetical protein